MTLSVPSFRIHDRSSVAAVFTRIFGVLTLSLAGLIAGCSQPAEKPAAGADSSAKGDDAAPKAAVASASNTNDTGSGPIKIGVFTSLTGSEATFGISTRNGVMLALEEINAAGGIKGRKVDVKVYDNQGNTQEAGTAVTRLITEDKVIAIIGDVASSLSLAGGAVAQEKGVPLISPASTNVRVTKDRDMVSRVCFVDSFQGFIAAKFLVDDKKMKKAAVLYDQNQAYSVGLRDDFQTAFKSLGGEITTVQAYSGGDQDFSAQLTSIRDSKPDAIYVPGYYTEVGNIAIQARRLGIKQPLIGGDGWDSTKLMETAAEALEGSYYSNHYSAEDTDPAIVAFVAKYKKQYGETPDALAALGYDAAKILFDALNRAASYDGKTLAATIASTKDFPGVTGVITIDENRNARKKGVVLEIKGGKPTFARAVEPQ